VKLDQIDVMLRFWARCGSNQKHIHAFIVDWKAGRQENAIAHLHDACTDAPCQGIIKHAWEVNRARGRNFWRAEPATPPANRHRHLSPISASNPQHQMGMITINP
jgi:hypothetical protein